MQDTEEKNSCVKKYMAVDKSGRNFVRSDFYTSSCRIFLWIAN